MAKTDFSSDQLLAIDSTGNVIVSAGAGSGKTTVLTERVRRNVLGENREKVSLDELLILTFTKDAAQSMKDKIKDALSEDESLSYLVPFVDSAHIETIDAYLQFIVKKYGYLMNYPNLINVVDDDILYVQCIKYIDEVLNSLYESDNEILREFTFNYIVRSERDFSNFIRDVIFNILFKERDFAGFLENYKQKILNKSFFSELEKKVEIIINEDLEKIDELLGAIANFKVRDYISSLISPLRGLKTFDEFKAVSQDLKAWSNTNDSLKIKGYSKSNDVNERDEDKLIEEFKDIYKEIVELANFDIETFEEIDVPNQIKYLGFFIDEIFMPVMKKLENFKYSKGTFTFTDISKMALNILKSNENVREELKNKYKLIMVDEYQDTSDDQEEIINLIANNNVFSVGDIKQSIYRFRGAKPKLFQSKYNAYSELNGGKAVNMNKNYRSRKEIINPINTMFSKIMTDDFGGANYKNDHVIEAANTDYDTYGKGRFAHGFFKLENAYKIGLALGYKNNNAKYYGEAYLVGFDIINRINHGYEVYDNKLKTLRKATYSDFTILSYKSKKFAYYQEVFKKLEIPLNAIYDETMREDLSIIIISNLLRALYLIPLQNKTNAEKDELKHTLVSIFRSYIFEYSDQKIYELFGNNNLYLEDPNYLKLSKLAYSYLNKSISEIYLDVLKELSYLDLSSKLSNVVKTLDKNDILYNKTKAMDAIGYNLHDFGEYFELINRYDIKMDQTIYSEATNAVTLTTVHKSKGLEYPLVYLPSLIDFSTGKESNTFTKFYVIGNYFFLPLFSDPTKKTNIFGKILKTRGEEVKEDKEERLRLFYVALTRAKEDIVFVYQEESPIDENEKLESMKNYFELNRMDAPNGNKLDYTKEALLRDKLLKNIDFGLTFASFLFKVNENDPLSNFIESDICHLDSFASIINGMFTKEAKVEPCDLINYYLENDYEFDYLKKYPDDVLSYRDDRIDEKKKVELPKRPLKLINEPKIFHGKVLLSLKYEEGKNGKHLIEAMISPYLTYQFNDLNAATVKKIIDEAQTNVFDTLFNCIKGTRISDNEVEIADSFKDLTEVNDKLNLINLHISPVLKTKKQKASKDRDDDSDESALNYGTHMHALLELTDFKTKDLSIIKSNKEKERVKKVIDLLDSNFDLGSDLIFKEYQFEDEIDKTRGIIDLLLINEGKKEAYIIDYKLKHIDDEAYKKQLKIYYDFVKNTFKKIEHIDCYLLSIVDAEIKKVEN